MYLCHKYLNSIVCYILLHIHIALTIYIRYILKWSTLYIHILNSLREFIHAYITLYDIHITSILHIHEYIVYLQVSGNIFRRITQHLIKMLISLHGEKLSREHIRAFPNLFYCAAMPQLLSEVMTILCAAVPLRKFFLSVYTSHMLFIHYILTYTLHIQHTQTIYDARMQIVLFKLIKLIELILYGFIYDCMLNCGDMFVRVYVYYSGVLFVC